MFHMPEEETKTCRVSGYRTRDKTLEIADAEGKTIPEVCEELGLGYSETTFLLNGVRIAASEVESTRVKPGDHLHRADKGDGNS